MTADVDVGSVVAGRYALRECLEEAPAYTSFRAFDQDAEVDVDFWWMRPELFPAQSLRDRFLGASVELRALSHPHLRKVFDAGLVGERGLYLTNQLGTHDGLLPEPGRGRLGPTDLLHYVTSIADALEAAHDIGYVHGRLVPSDIVHVSGLIKLGGVGLWADADPVSARRCWSEWERFIAPEVFAGGAATPAADVYSLARICGELAAGSSAHNIAAELMASDPLLADALSPALSVAPHRRPASARALLDAVRAVLVDDRVPTGDSHVAPPQLRLPSGGVDSGTPIDAGGYAEEDDPTKHIGRAPSIDGFPDDPLAPPPGLRPGRGLGKSLSASRAGFDDDLATVAESGMPAHMPPPAVPRRRKSSQTRPDGSDNTGPVLALSALPGRSALPGTSPARAPVPAPLPVAPGAAHRAHGKPPRPRAVKTKLDGSPPVIAEHDSRLRMPLSAAGPTHLDSAPPGLDSGPMPAVGGFAAPDSPPLSAPPPSDPSPGAAPRRRALDRLGTESGPIRFVSMKAQDDVAPRTPRVAIVDRPDMKPKLRSLATVRPESLPTEPLGHYAPARPATVQQFSEAAAPRWVWALVALAVIAVAVTVAVVMMRGRGGGASASAPDAAPTIVKPRPKPVAVVRASFDAGVRGPCDPGMVVVAEHGVCIDEYESPGKGRMPEVGLSAAQAAAKCRARGARLCTSVEWEAACRGTGNASWPYGSAYSPRACNANRRTRAEIAVTGSFPECKSGVGAYDMSGNVAEWIAGGTVRGGSAANVSDGRCSSRQRRATGERGYSDVGFRCCATARGQ